MPGNRFGIFAYFLIIEFANGPTPEVIVVINQPNLRLQSSLFDCGSQVLSHILNFDLLWKQARRHPAVLICINLVLRSHSIDHNTLGFICLEKFHNIVCIRAEIAAAKSAAQHRVIVFHPTRWTPGRSQKKQLFVDLARAPKNRENIVAIMGNGES